MEANLSTVSEFSAGTNDFAKIKERAIGTPINISIINFFRLCNIKVINVDNNINISDRSAALEFIKKSGSVVIKSKMLKKYLVNDLELYNK